MEYAEALHYLFGQLPMFSRIGAAAYKANLDNTHALAEALHHPERKFKSIHIAGTNGKGSTSHMLSGILQTAGYRTGLYTSPHLLDFRERIRINGSMIPEKKVADFTSTHLNLFERIQPSFFEMTVALAFQWFAEQEVDIAVIETGLGGRLDSTNIIHPELSIITNISFDHMNLLGDTLSRIAEEKAGIIKPKTPVLIGERQEELRTLFESKASISSSSLRFADEMFSAEMKDGKCLLRAKNTDTTLIAEPALKGAYQKKNILTVAAAVRMLQEQGLTIADAAMIEGIQRTTALTGLRGRWELLRENPKVYADIAHNEAGIQALTEQLQLCFFGKLHLVIGMVSDKDTGKVLSLLPADARYYFCKADLPRAMPAEALGESAAKFGLAGKVIPSVKTAVETAIQEAEPEDMIVICGSAFVVAEALSLF